MSQMISRAVIVHRQSDYEALLARHGTRGQAAYFLETRGQDIGPLERDHACVAEALNLARAAVPKDWRCSQILRPELDRFLFEPKDVVIVVGQDGLVANVSKYLSGQIVLGVNPDPERNAGILVPLEPGAVGDLLAAASRREVSTEQRTMAEARLDDGQRLLSLNEFFIGHRSHQSARYLLRFGKEEERQSSSGLIVSTGTGATGWAKSISSAYGVDLQLQPDDEALVFFAREPFSSPTTTANLKYGYLESAGSFEVRSQMNDGGVIFADGIEQDYLRFDWGRLVQVRRAKERLHLAVG